MPRSVLGSPASRGVGQDLRTRAAGQSSPSTLKSPQLALRLRQKRSPAYMAALQRLDAGAHVQNAAALQSLIDAIANEFPELAIDQRPMGIIAKCFLGEPYEVHRCDLDGSIIEHFERFRQMPPLYERGRALATHGAYVLIEVYADSLRAIGRDGSVAVF